MNEHFELLLSRYQAGFGTSMKDSEFYFQIISTFVLKLSQDKICNMGSYIDSPDRIKKKKATISPKNKDDKCFQYAIAVPLNYKKIKWNPERADSIVTDIQFRAAKV